MNTGTPNHAPTSSGRGANAPGRTQYSTFTVSGHLYGVPVMRVREVVRPLPITAIPLASRFVHGLINLRGQVVTAIGVHRLFGIGSPPPEKLMNVICESGSTLISLQADEIGDVVEMETHDLEAPPATTADGIKEMLEGVYKMPNRILSIVDVDRI
ncbi:hypothetical protein EBZ80_01630, partial [bacterium]|nr:hypothetical protein [bacterium]